MTDTPATLTPAQRVRAHRRREALGLVLVQFESPPRLASALDTAVAALLRPYVDDALAGHLGPEIQAAWAKEQEGEA